MNELSTPARDLVAVARIDMSPDGAARARVRSAVLVRVGVAAAAGTTLTASASSASATSGTVGATLGSSVVVKLLISVAIVGGIGTAGYMASNRGARPAPVVEPTLAAGPATPAARVPVGRAIATAPPSEPPLLSPVTTDDRRAEPVADDVVVTRSSLSQELSVLHAADKALERGDAATALALAHEYETAHPDGVLQPELAAIRVDALCALDLAEPARQDAQRFIARWPDSPLVERVSASCAKEGAE